MYTSCVPDTEPGDKRPGSHVVYTSIPLSTNRNNNALPDKADQGKDTKPVKSGQSVLHSMAHLSLLDDDQGQRSSTPVPPTAPRNAKWRAIKIRPATAKKIRPPTPRPHIDDKPRPLEILEKLEKESTARHPKNDKPRPLDILQKIEKESTDKRSIDDKPRQLDILEKLEKLTALSPTNDSPRPPDILEKLEKEITARAHKDDKSRPHDVLEKLGKSTARPPINDKPRPLDILEKLVKESSATDETPSPVDMIQKLEKVAAATADSRHTPAPPTTAKKKINRPAVRTKSNRNSTAIDDKSERIQQKSRDKEQKLPEKPKPKSPSENKEARNTDAKATAETPTRNTFGPSEYEVSKSITTPTRNTFGPSEYEVTKSITTPTRNRFGPSEYEVTKPIKKPPALAEAVKKITAILKAANATNSVVGDEMSATECDNTGDYDYEDDLEDDEDDADHDKLPAVEVDGHHEKYEPGTEDLIDYVTRVSTEVLLSEFKRWKRMEDEIKLKSVNDEKKVDSRWLRYTDIQKELEAATRDLVTNVKANMSTMVELQKAATDTMDMVDMNNKQELQNATEAVDLVELIKRTNVQGDMVQAFKDGRLDSFILRIKLIDTADAAHETLKLNKELHSIRDVYNDAMNAEIQPDTTELDLGLDLSEITSDVEDDIPLTPRLPMKQHTDDMAMHKLAKDSSLEKCMKYRKEREASLNVRKLQKNKDVADDIRNGGGKVDIEVTGIREKGSVKNKRDKVDVAKCSKRKSHAPDILKVHTPALSKSTPEVSRMNQQNTNMELSNFENNTAKYKVNTKPNKSTNKIYEKRLQRNNKNSVNPPKEMIKEPMLKLPQINNKPMKEIHNTDIEQTHTSTTLKLPKIPNSDKWQEHRPTTRGKDGTRRPQNHTSDVELPPINMSKSGASRRRR